MNVDRLASSFSIDVKRPIVGDRTDRITRLDQRRQVRAAELDETLAVAPKAMIAPVVLAAAMVSLFWTTPAREQTLELSGLIALLVLGITMIVWRGGRHIGVTVSVDLGRQIAGTFALCLGAAWGAVPIVLFATANGDQRLMLLTLLLGMIADVLLFGPILTVCLAFLAPLLTGALIGIALGGNAGSIALAGCLVIAAISVVTALRRLQVISSLRIADRLQADERAQTIETLLLDFQENTSDWLWELDASRRLHNVSERVAVAADLPLRRLEGMKFTSLFKAGRVSALIADRKPFRQELVEVATTGTPIWWRVSGKPIHDEAGAFLGYRGIGIDITQIRNAESRINYLATFDSLTGLANRVQFQGHLARECEAVVEDGHWRALLYLDLDGFKSVNDGFGHAAGDALLKDAARRLSSCVPTGVMVARLGGDEFGIWYPAVTPDQGRGFGRCHHRDHRRALRRAGERRVDRRQYRDRLHAQTRHRARHAARQGRSRALSGQGRGQGALSGLRGRIRNLHRRASRIAERTAARHRSTGIRAALPAARRPLPGQGHRFRSTDSLAFADTRLHLAADFIPAAESTGQIVAIGRWVLFQACKEATRWPDDISIAVNVSPQQFRAPISSRPSSSR